METTVRNPECVERAAEEAERAIESQTSALSISLIRGVDDIVRLRVVELASGFRRLLAFIEQSSAPASKREVTFATWDGVAENQLRTALERYLEAGYAVLRDHPVDAARTLLRADALVGVYDPEIAEAATRGVGG